MGRVILVGPMLRSARELRETLSTLRFSRRDQLIAVDRGLDHCRRARLPVTLAIGDWDSARNLAALATTRHLTLPTDKDRSDLYFALQVALDAGAREIVVIGASGGRPDHALAVQLDLAEVARLGHRGGRLGPRAIELIDGGASISFVSSRTGAWSRSLARGQTVSIFALGAPARGVTIRGFEFSLSNATLHPGSRGLSNRVSAKRCEVSLKSGVVAVMVLTKGLRPL